MVDKVKTAPRRHFGVEAAKEFRQQHSAAYTEEGANNPQPEPTPGATTPQPEPTPSPTPTPQPEPTPTPAPQDVTTSIFDLGLTPPGTPQPDTSAADNAIELAKQRIAELEAQNGELTAAQQRELELRQQQQAELEELRELKRKQEIDRLMSFEGLEMDNIDPQAAQEIGAKLLRPVLERQQQSFDNRIQEITQRLEDDRKEREKLATKMTDGERNAQLVSTNNKIFAAHPDFADLRNSKEFETFLNSTIRGSSLKLANLIADEYHSGNADFVIQAINEFKKGRPSLEDIASVQAAGTGSEPASQTDAQPEFTAEDVADWNNKVVTGEMTRAEFRENMAKFRAAQAAPAK